MTEKMEVTEGERKLILALREAIEDVGDGKVIITFEGSKPVEVQTVRKL